MEVLKQLIYEYKKGVRPLLLHTVVMALADDVETVLKKHSINYIKQPCCENCNFFFGNEFSLEVIKSFLDKELHSLTPQEDFMLGALLGYDLVQQSERYLKKTDYSCSK